MRLVLSITLGLAASLCLAEGAIGTAAGYNELRVQADEALADDQFREAEGLYLRLTRAEEADAAAHGWFRLGICLAEQNRPAEAVRAWESLRRYHPGHELAAESLWRQAGLPRTSDRQREQLLDRLRADYPESPRAIALTRQRQQMEGADHDLEAPDDHRALSEWARRMAASGRVDGVLAQLSRIIDDPLVTRRDDPRIIVARTEKARILAHLRRPEEAVRVLMPLAAINDEATAVAAALRAADLAGQADAPQVLTAIGGLLRRPGLGEAQAEALHWAGSQLHLRTSDAETARRALQAFSNRFPDSQHRERAQQLLATVTPVADELLPPVSALDPSPDDLDGAARLLTRGRPEAALDALDRALRSLSPDEPDRAMAWLLKGRAKARLGDPDEALALWRQARRHADQFGQQAVRLAARHEPAVLLLEHKLQPREALALLEEALELAAEEEQAGRLRLVAARACLLLDDPGAARDWLLPLHRARADRPAGPPTELDHLLRAAGVTVPGLSDDPLEPSPPAAPQDVDRLLRLADLAFHTGDPRAALQAYERLARTPRLAPDLSDYIVLQRARCVQRLFRPRDALRLYQHFHRRGADSPFAPAARLRLGVLQAGGLDDKAAAIREFESLAELHPQAPEAAQALLHLATLHEVMGRPNEARDVLTLFLRRFAAHPAVEHARRESARLGAEPPSGDRPAPHATPAS